MPAILLAALAVLPACTSEPPPPEPQAPDPQPTWQPTEGRELIGKPAPAWSTNKTWHNSDPLTLEGLRGKVVLLRFWMIGCKFCRNTAPALVALHEKYSEAGLVVLGFHHPKSKAGRDHRLVLETAGTYGFDFPIAFDDDWEALNKFWFPNREERKFTSVTFLVDREGRIAWLHDGGEFHRGGDDDHVACQRAYASLDARIAELLAQ